MEGLVGILQVIHKLITSNRTLSATAFGILLLGKRFEENIHKQEPVDPTEAILREGQMDIRSRVVPPL